jgi:hypothetical protein
MANFTAVGTYLQTEFTGAGSIALNNQGVGNLILLAAPSIDSTANWVTGITGGGATWTQLGTTFHGVTNGMISTIWAGVVTATGAQTASIAVTGGGPTIPVNGNEFSLANGWALDAAGTLDSAGTATWPSLTPVAAGDLYFGWAVDSGLAVAGSTPGYTYTVNSHSDGAAWNVNCGSGATAPVWGDAHQVFGPVVLIKPASAAPSPSGLLMASII